MESKRKYITNSEEENTIHKKNKLYDEQAEQESIAKTEYIQQLIITLDEYNTIINQLTIQINEYKSIIKNFNFTQTTASGDKYNLYT